MTTAIKERPILFSGPMVLAILEGRKTQTRRVVKHYLPTGPCDIRDIGHGPEIYGAGGCWIKLKCPYGQPGDRLWVRETWVLRGNEDGHPITADGALCHEREAQRLYRADAIPAAYGLEQLPDGLLFEGGWRPSIHMPRWASRITLEVTDVRVERLRDISEADAIAEGTQCAGVPASLTNVGAFAKLWNSINGAGAWELNPWVWVVDFKRVTT